MKLWAVHFMSESSDHYYETFCSKTQPTNVQLEIWWKNSTYGEHWDNISIREVFEVDPKSPELK